MRCERKVCGQCAQRSPHTRTHLTDNRAHYRIHCVITWSLSACVRCIRRGRPANVQVGMGLYSPATEASMRMGHGPMTYIARKQERACAWGRHLHSLATGVITCMGHGLRAFFARVSWDSAVLAAISGLSSLNGYGGRRSLALPYAAQ